MKKLFLTLLVAAGCFAVHAEGDWRTTLSKVVNLKDDTGIAGFGKKEAPAFITGNFDAADRPQAKPFSANRNGYYDAKCEWHGGYFDDTGAFVKGHEVKVLGGLRYGVGQLIMIPLCLVMLNLAIGSSRSGSKPFTIAR